jgi:hypothetical protein
MGAPLRKRNIVASGTQDHVCFHGMQREKSVQVNHVLQTSVLLDPLVQASTPWRPPPSLYGSG